MWHEQKVLFLSHSPACLIGARRLTCRGMIGLLAPGATPPFDIWDDTGTHADIRDRFGKNMSDDQIMELCDRYWGIKRDAHVELFNGEGKQMLTRNTHNDRGDLGSRLGLKQSLESMGLLLELRKGPFF